MSPRRLRLLGRFLMVAGVLVYLLALVGEILGWWNDVGVLLSAGGLVSSLAGLAITAWSVASVKGGELLGKQDQMLGNQERMVGNQEKMLGNQERMLELSSRTLTWQDGATRSLDRIEAALDEA
ncbi:MAG: hypothetical protein R3185_02980 [Candidatus Thermoplasmatota archaeon]|nr:hypothetical protein [Candidatus Thermoplasmatota archaeon]